LQAPNTQRQQLSKMPDFFYLESPYSMHAPWIILNQMQISYHSIKKYFSMCC
jgi:hypothetical protein